MFNRCKHACRRCIQRSGVMRMRRRNFSASRAAARHSVARQAVTHTTLAGAVACCSSPAC
ncbi:peptide ABC transporter ATP-binding [Micractinium conductrix]|uniref:Peptide ABC transporter ATP-binding n=1 Tax=Micractinium conductrix TaxID=554055 RepID=A0A2P6V5Q3_9CHLO|nr:peptide ABC transporter ATP-binding [Micractinium conductrix]|eukprot:PSC69421.1 peptide ABC transporter ATP-binding [Micractinium conductrix]